jgi:pilus assembly protein CpaE
MRALVIGDNETLTTKLGEIVTRSGLGYRTVDIVRLAAALDSASRVHYELTVVALPADPDRCVDVVGRLRNAVPSTLLAVGPTNDAKLVLRVLRQGADAYLDQNELEGEFTASLARLKARRTSDARNGRIVGVLGASGGSGTSSLAANLAVLLAKWYGEVALVDTHTAVSDLAVLLDLKPAHHLGDLCRNVARLDQNMFQQSLVRHPGGVQLLAAPGTFDEAALVTPPGVREVLALARGLFPFVMLDLDQALRPEHVAAVLQTDFLLVVLRLDIASLRNARRTLDHLQQLGVANDRICVVANRYGQPKELPLRKVEQALGIAIADRIADDPAAMNSAANAGVPVVVDRPRAAVSKGLLRLAAKLKDLDQRYRSNGHGTPVYGSGGSTPFVVAEEK